MKLSIITINRNNSEGLRKTIESVVSQTFTDFEYIIIDGASTDYSVDIIKEYADRITYWVSEPDNGIYNAMNKGILKAKGEYLLFLNSGDWLYDNCVVQDFIRSKLNEDIISGNIIFFKQETEILNKSIEKDNLTYAFFYDNSIFHPSTFIKRVLFSVYGMYNENFKIVSDWEFFFKALIVNNCSYSRIDRVISYYDLTGISSQPEWKIVENSERECVLKSISPFVYNSYKKLNDENIMLRERNQEYINLIHGRFSLIVKLLLWIKSRMKVHKIH